MAAITVFFLPSLMLVLFCLRHPCLRSSLIGHHRRSNIGLPSSLIGHHQHQLPISAHRHRHLPVKNVNRSTKEHVLLPPTLDLFLKLIPRDVFVQGHGSSYTH
ncbi:hypothetical protein COCNU_scaffold000865G000010 [Cocos nucifera]|nr:hypothetical protein [Cocos nucifera]